MLSTPQDRHAKHAAGSTPIYGFCQTPKQDHTASDRYPWPHGPLALLSTETVKLTGNHAAADDGKVHGHGGKGFQSKPFCTGTDWHGNIGCRWSQQAHVPVPASLVSPSTRSERETRPCRLRVLHYSCSSVVPDSRCFWGIAQCWDDQAHVRGLPAVCLQTCEGMVKVSLRHCAIRDWGGLACKFKAERNFFNTFQHTAEK